METPRGVLNCTSTIASSKAMQTVFYFFFLNYFFLFVLTRARIAKGVPSFGKCFFIFNQVSLDPIMVRCNMVHTSARVVSLDCPP